MISRKIKASWYWNQTNGKNSYRDDADTELFILDKFLQDGKVYYLCQLPNKEIANVILSAITEVI